MPLPCEGLEPHLQLTVEIQLGSVHAMYIHRAAEKCNAAVPLREREAGSPPGSLCPYGMRYPGPRTTIPGFAPVTLPSSTTGTPFTST